MQDIKDSKLRRYFVHKIHTHVLYYSQALCLLIDMKEICHLTFREIFASIIREQYTQVGHQQ